MPRFSPPIWIICSPTARCCERIDAAAAAGFKAVELPFPYDVPAAQLKAAIERNKLTVLGINSPHGERDGEFGLAAVPGREKEWQALFAAALDYITAIGGSAVHCLAGKVDPGSARPRNASIVDNLKRAADLAAAKNITLLIEPINPRDRPDYFLIPRRARRRHHRQGRQAEHQHAVRFLSCADRRRRSDPPAGKILLPVIGHLQCAQVPVAPRAGRGGEINYPVRVRGGRPARLQRLDRRRIPAARRTEDGLGWGGKYGLKASR